jgi:hypothetical protein
MPQMTGVAKFPEDVTEKVSDAQSPIAPPFKDNSTTYNRLGRGSGGQIS